MKFAAPFSPASRRTGWWIVALAFAVPLAFAGFTHHVWEDYYITLRSSRNLLEGHGLVFQPGERVHTFTSPLGVLLPALCLWLSHGHETLALWLFRLGNAALLAAAAGLVWRRVTALGLGSIGRWVLFGLVLLDAKLADFAINGQEAALLVFFTLLLWEELERPEGARAARLALAYGGLMWTRPDAFILAGAITLSHLIWPARPGSARSTTWRAVLCGAALGVVIYAPWLLWAWSYYGSPVPHTIIAKGMQTPTPHFADLLLMPLRALSNQSIFDSLFLPTYWVFGGWPRDLHNLAHLLTALAAFGWLVPVLPAPGRRASFAVFIGMFYLCTITLYGWYLPPWSALGAIALAFEVDAVHAACVAKNFRRSAAAVRIGAAVVIAVQAIVLGAVAWQMRVQQRVIEDGGRRLIGEWLRQHAAPADTVFLEPVGYIGYFSRLKIYDFPGLSSREVVDAIRQGAANYADVVNRLHPTWLVLRPRDLVRQGFPADGRIPGYQIVRLWDAQAALDAVRFLPGRDWLEFDAQFLLLHRVP